MKGSILGFLLLTLVSTALADPRQWDHAGIPLRHGNYIDWYPPVSAQDIAGNTLIVWSDTRAGNRDIIAQLYSPAGTPLWTAGGMNVSPGAPSYQIYPVACPVTGGWIIAWIDFRVEHDHGEYEYPFGDVWAQKLDYNGNIVWTDRPTGAPVDTAGTCVSEGSLCITHDGSGGAIIAWEDINHSRNLYAQRVLSNGTNAWATSRAVTDARTGTRTPSAAASDSDGNMLVAWQDYRDGGDSTDIYAAKITPQGTLPWGSGVNGVLVCGAPTYQGRQNLCSDGQGGCYIAWVDQRSANYHIYEQRLNASGVAQWTPNGILVCNASHNQEDVRVATSWNGSTPDGCLAVWEDPRVNGERKEIYAQKVSAQGAALWLANGLKVCGNAGADSLGPTGQTRDNVHLASDLAGGLICVWEDTRNCDNDLQLADLYAGRVLSSGSLVWNGENGVLVANGPRAQSYPAIQSGNSGALIAYDDNRDGSQSLRLQQLTLANGTRTLPDTGRVIIDGMDGDATDSKAVAMSGGRTAVVWGDGRSYANQLYYQIFSSSGQMERRANGDTLAPDNTGSSIVSQSRPQVCPDGSGGFFVTFEDLRTGSKTIRLAHVNSAGNRVSSRAAEVVWRDSQTTDQERAFCTPDGQGGCYVAWERYNLVYNIDVFVMRMDANCHPLWQLPVPLTNTYDDDIVHGLVSNPDGCCIVVWRSGPFDTYNISAAKICGDRSVVYNHAVCDTIDEQDNPAVVADGQGGAYFAWSDKRSDQVRPGLDKDIYAQRLNAQGSDLWTHNGIPVIVDTFMQDYPQLAMAVDGNLLVAWDSYSIDSSMSVYAQKITPAGTLLWPDTGAVISNARGDQYDVAILPDNGTGLFAVWTSQDEHSYWPQVYGTHLGGNGQPIGDPYWVPNRGGALSNPTSQCQWQQQIVSDGAGGFVAVWVDERASSEEPVFDLYAQRLQDAAGTDDRPSALPKTYSLSQNYPNPFNPTTIISFALPKAGLTTLRVYDILGRQVSTLVNRTMPAGNHMVAFDASRLASGIYFYRLESGSFSSTRKMILLK